MPRQNIFRQTIGLIFLFDLALAIQVIGSDTYYNYSVIESTGKACESRDSCFPRQSRDNTRGPIENSWKRRNCFCDDSCAFYGDCCIDAKAYDHEEQKERVEAFSCVKFKHYDDIYVKTTCPPDWTLPNIRTACERVDDIAADPFATMPVTNMKSRHSYRNYYCAVCNRDSVGLRFWQPRIECPTLKGYSSRFQNITTELIQKSLRFDEDRQKWGVLFDTSGIPVFHECIIDPAVPDTLMHLIRQCSGRNIMSTCPPDYPDPRVRDLCLSYTAKLFSGTRSYRNVHCAICNGADLDRLTCWNIAPLGRNNWRNNFGSFSFAVLFDISGEGNVVGHETKCKEGELFDPFFKKCRNVMCARSVEIVRDGKCIDPTAVTSTTTSTTTTSTTTTTTSETTAPTTTLSTTTSTTTSTITSTTTSTTTSSVPTTVTTETTTQPSIEKETTISSTSTAPPPVSSGSVVPSGSSISSTTTTVSTTSIAFTKFVNTTQAPKSEGEAPSSSVISTSAPSSTNLKVSLSASEEIGNSSTKDFSTCPKFQLEKGEFEILDDNSSTVYIAKYKTTLQQGEFDLKDDRLVICATVGVEHTGKFSEYMSWITIICLSLSIGCLCLHILVSLLVPELHNLSGKNLLSLSVSLLGGYASFIAAMFYDRPNTNGCFVLAVAMYFFFISSFCWMLVIAFDVFRTLKLATAELRLSSGAQWKRFFLYSVVGWLLPCTFVATTVIIEHLKNEIPDAYRPGFGAHEFCWFSNKRALLMYFAVPFSVIMAVNVILFIVSSCLVFEATRTTAVITTCAPTVNFHLYLRLAVLMGLTWITGLLAGFFDMEPIWYAFIALNTLQGLFIFLAFTCTKKVIHSLRQRLWTSSEPEDNSWRWSKSSSQATKRTTSSSRLTGTDDGFRGGGVYKTPSAAASLTAKYSSRGKTMYAVSKMQTNQLTTNSFGGRYY